MRHLPPGTPSLVLFSLFVLACGPVPSGLGAGTSAFACDVSQASPHTCTEYDGLPASDVDGQLAACSASRGTAVAACPTTDQLGTCALEPIGGGAGTVALRQAYYAGGGTTGTDAAQACSALGGTWTAADPALTQISCSFSQSNVTSAPPQLCELFIGLGTADRTTAESDCTMGLGTVGVGCPPGALGQCATSAGGYTATLFFYGNAGLTAGEAQMACMSDSGQWTPSP